MKLAHKIAGACCAFFLLSSTINAEIILLEDFEDYTVTYQSSVNDSLASFSNNDYFGILSQQPNNTQYDNRMGNGYYGVQDTNGVFSNPVTNITLTWSNIDISDWQNLTLSWFVAEGDSSDNREDIDSNTSFEISTRLNGSGYQTLFDVSSSNGTNSSPVVIEGSGLGTEITSSFQQFSSNLASGTFLDIKIGFNNFDAGDEDFAFDQLMLSGDRRLLTRQVPEPSSLFLMLPAFLLLKRKVI